MLKQLIVMILIIAICIIPIQIVQAAAITIEADYITWFGNKQEDFMTTSYDWSTWENSTVGYLMPGQEMTFEKHTFGGDYYGGRFAAAGLPAYEIELTWGFYNDNQRSTTRDHSLFSTQLLDTELSYEYQENTALQWYGISTIYTHVFVQNNGMTPIKIYSNMVDTEGLESTYLPEPEPDLNYEVIATYRTTPESPHYIYLSEGYHRIHLEHFTIIRDKDMPRIGTYSHISSFSPEGKRGMTGTSTDFNFRDFDIKTMIDGELTSIYEGTWESSMYFRLEGEAEEFLFSPLDYTWMQRAYIRIPIEYIPEQYRYNTALLIEYKEIYREIVTPHYIAIGIIDDPLDVPEGWEDYTTDDTPVIIPPPQYQGPYPGMPSDNNPLTWFVYIKDNIINIFRTLSEGIGEVATEAQTFILVFTTVFNAMPTGITSLVVISMTLGLLLWIFKR